MKSIDELLAEWHETRNIGTASEICERLWKMANNGGEEDGRDRES